MDAVALVCGDCSDGMGVLSFLVWKFEKDSSLDLVVECVRTTFWFDFGSVELEHDTMTVFHSYECFH